MPEDRSPHRDHAAEQREADQRARFMRHCDEDGVNHAAARHSRSGMGLTQAAAMAAAARNSGIEHT